MIKIYETENPKEKFSGEELKKWFMHFDTLFWNFVHILHMELNVLKLTL